MPGPMAENRKDKDQAHKAGDQIQKIHDEFIKKIDEIAEAKEKEVMEI